MRMWKHVVARSAVALIVSAAMIFGGSAVVHAAEGEATVSGQITLEGGGQLPSWTSAYVRACPVQGGECSVGGAAHPSGEYVVTVDAPAEYTLCLDGGAFTDLIAECWLDGAAVALTVGQNLDLDWQVTLGGHLTGTVSYFSPSLGSLTGANGTRVTLYRLDDSGEFFAWYEETEVPPGYPSFTFYALPPGTYAVHFLAMSAFQNELLLNSEYWEDARYWAERTDLVIATGDRRDLGDVVLAPRTLDVPRIEGPTRFEVAVNVSRALYQDEEIPTEGVPVVYVANGLNFPDALTAGPAAAIQGGVVLLVAPGSIPAAVVDELERLRPQRIVVAGGPGSVSPQVFDQLADFVPAPANVVRAGGADRYEASRTVVRDAFGGSGAEVAIIATGANFPDALSAGPAAASQSGPVILVDGLASSIDAATRQLLLDLDIRRVYIAGGTGSVSPGIETSLNSLLGSGSVVRFAGADRFEVGVLISQEFFSSAEYTFVATGFNFPDALTGGPLAAAYGSPLYLSRPECLPPSVAFDILELDAQAVVLLGGPGSLSPAVQQLALC